MPAFHIRKMTEPVPDTVNHAGGKAFSLTPEYKLAFALVSSFLEPSFYEKRDETVKGIQDAVKNVSPEFAAKAAIFSRTQYGMRSTSHLVAAEIAKNVKGAQWTKSFFEKVVHRVDDASEILAAYMSMYGKPVPNSLKKGLAQAMSKFSRYQLAKYKGENKGVKLVDLFNITHPKPSEDNAQAFTDLMKGELASEDTWEAMISEAGQNCKTPAEATRKKNEAWKELLTSKKIGYFALLRNLRNILKTEDDETINAACKMLVDKKLIEKSLVLPFRYMTALKELESPELQSRNAGSQTRKVLKAVNDAVEVALSNVPVFEGETLVAIDCSGSMTWGDDNTKTPAAIASMFAGVVARSNNADVMLFDDRATHVNISLTSSVMAISNDLRSKFRGGGTNFDLIFDEALKKYDRIVIMSDMQAWVGGNTPQIPYFKYCTRFKANPKVYCFDLKGHGTTQFPRDHVYNFAGWSEKVLDVMKVLEEDPRAFINQINAIEL